MLRQEIGAIDRLNAERAADLQHATGLRLQHVEAEVGRRHSEAVVVEIAFTRWIAASSSSA
jgi:hypothetical protein